MNEAIEKFQLEQTCDACPEQYRVYLGGKQVGLFHVRHGWFTVDLVGSETVYSAEIRGDGMFDESERDFCLNVGCAFLLEALREREVGPLLFEYGSPSEGQRDD